MPTVPQSSGIRGLTNPFFGDRAASVRYAHGHTFRWVKGDRYIAVMRGTCVDGHRYLVLHDNLEGHKVLEGHQPLVDAIPVPYGEWFDDEIMNRLTDTWAGQRQVCAGCGRER